MFRTIPNPVARVAARAAHAWAVRRAVARILAAFPGTTVEEVTR